MVNLEFRHAIVNQFLFAYDRSTLGKSPANKVMNELLFKQIKVYNLNYWKDESKLQFFSKAVNTTNVSFLFYKVYADK